MPDWDRCSIVDTICAHGGAIALGKMGLPEPTFEEFAFLKLD